MEREDGQRKYLIEADQFNDCLVGLEANTARFDVVWPGWPRKSCESEDSGMGRDNVGGRDGGDGGEQVEEEQEEEQEPSLQFAKCRAGIQLYREMSLVSRKEVWPRPRPVSRQECEEEISHLSHLLTVMASMRMDDQRCTLDTRDTQDSQDNKQRKKSSKLKMPALSCSTAAYKSYKETILELEGKKVPLPQILLLPTSQWRIHQPPPGEGNDDLSISRSFITSARNYG